MYFDFVGPGGDVQNLRTVVERGGWCGLQSIYEYDRTRWGAGHHDLGWIGQLRSP